MDNVCGYAEKLEAFETWLYRRMLRISWKDMVTNEDPISQNFHVMCTSQISWRVLGMLIVGRFYYDKSTKTLYKYSHDRLEIKDISCIHQGIEREKKEMAAILFR